MPSLAHLMHACLDMASCEPLHLLASLKEQAAFRHLDCHTPSIPQPDEQAWETRLPMDGQEIQVVVEASICCLQQVVLLQIRACTGAGTDGATEAGWEQAGSPPPTHSHFEPGIMSTTACTGPSGRSRGCRIRARHAAAATTSCRTSTHRRLTSGRKEVGPICHAGSESVCWQVEANGQHGCCSLHCCQHFVAPAIHHRGPLREACSTRHRQCVSGVQLGIRPIAKDVAS